MTDQPYEDLSLCAAGDRADVYVFDLPPYTTDVRAVARYARGAQPLQRASIRDANGLSLSSGWSAGDTETAARARVCGGGRTYAYLEQDESRTDYTLEIQTVVRAPGACGNGQDDDEDGLIDGGDPGCAHIFDEDEADVGMPACANGVDDDQDGQTDWPDDRDCVAAGHTDASRPCTHAGPVRWLEVPDEPVVDTTVVVDTDRPSLTQGYCNPAGVGEEIIAFTLNRERRFFASTEAWDTAPPALSLRTVCTLQVSELACDRSAHFASPAQILETLPAGTYFLVVEGQRPQTGTVTVRFLIQ